MSPLSLLTILLIVAKLADWITISWLLVFSPIILQIVLAVALIIWLVIKA